MKGFLKNICLAAIALFIIGVGLIIFGAILGGRLTNITIENGILSISDVDFNFAGFNTQDDTVYLDEDIESDKQTTKVKVMQDENINSLEFSLGAVEAHIQPGDKFEIKTYGQISYDNYVDEGTWVVKIKNHKGKFNNDEKIWITFPRDTEFDEVSIFMGAGSADVDGITADEISFDVGAGKIKATNIICSREGNLTAGAAQIEASGQFLGETKLNCGMGKIVLKLNEVPKDYGHRVTVGLGKVIVFDQSYRGVRESETNTSAKCFFDISVGMGQVRIE